MPYLILNERISSYTADVTVLEMYGPWPPDKILAINKELPPLAPRKARNPPMFEFVKPMGGWRLEMDADQHTRMLVLILNFLDSAGFKLVGTKDRHPMQGNHGTYIFHGTKGGNYRHTYSEYHGESGMSTKYATASSAGWSDGDTYRTGASGYPSGGSGMSSGSGYTTGSSGFSTGSAGSGSNGFYQTEMTSGRSGKSGKSHKSRKSSRSGGSSAGSRGSSSSGLKSSNSGSSYQFED